MVFIMVPIGLLVRSWGQLWFATACFTVAVTVLNLMVADELGRVPPPDQTLFGMLLHFALAAAIGAGTFGLKRALSKRPAVSPPSA